MPTLSGTIADVTGSPISPEDIVEVAVKAPAPRVSGGDPSQIVTTVTIPVEVGSNGSLSVTLDPGPAVLIVRTFRSHDTYPMVVLSGMVSISEAIAQAGNTVDVSEETVAAITGLLGQIAAERMAAQSARDDAQEAAQDAADAAGPAAAEAATNAVQAALQDEAIINAVGWRRPALTAESDIDELKLQNHSGYYPVAPNSLAQALGLPGDGEGGLTVEWLAGVTNPTTVHVWRLRTGEVWSRDLKNGVWSAFTQGFPQAIKDYIDSRSGSSGTKPIPAGKTLDDLKFEADQATYRITSASEAAAVGFPEAGSPYSTVKVEWIAGTSTPAAFQEAKGYSGSVYRRTAKASQGWSSWIKDRSSGGGSAEPTLLERARAYGDPAMNRELALRRTGGAIGTGGKAVVALRFDHNNRPFNDKILPLLKARGLPASQAQFVNALNMQQNYTNDDSTGMTWSDIESNCVSGGVEVWNHSWSHTNGELFHEIVESKAELERVMPKLAVRGMFRPGVPDGDWGGFNVSPFSDSLFYSTEAGRLVNQVHAACNGAGDVYWPLGSGMQFGFNHAGLDSVTAASHPIAIVNAAKDRGAGVIFMHHPNLLDYGAGYITTAVLTEFLDFLVAERDAGRIEILTVGGMLNADSNLPAAHRSDLARNPTFLSNASWSGSGWTRGSGQAATSGTSSLAQTSSFRWAEGAVRQLTVEGTATAGATITIAVTGTGLSVSKEFTFSAGPNVFRLPFMLPLGAGNTTFSATGDGSAITLTRFSCFAA